MIPPMMHYDRVQWHDEQSGYPLKSLWQAPDGAVIGINENVTNFYHLPTNHRSSVVMRRMPQ